MRHVYLDHTATTPLDQRVFDAMRLFFAERFGNASSVHRFGREARAALDESRDTIARAIGARASELFFVSGGTEADNFALKGIAHKLRETGKTHVVSSATEHHAVLETCEYLREEGFLVTLLEADQHGGVDPDEVSRAMTPSTGLVSIMHANNEVGTINPVEAIAQVCRERGALFHSDAVQSLGKLRIDVRSIGADLLSFSAHKLYGPKGIGALYVRKGVAIGRFVHGGGQERGRRAGTENVPLAVGFARAVELADAEREREMPRLEDLKQKLRGMIAGRFPSALFNGDPRHSLPHILNVSFDGDVIELDGEALLFNLDLAGIAVTSGSACTSGSMKPSHVLLAMGRSPATAKATIRFSMGRSTTEDDLVYVVDRLDDIVQRIGTPRRVAV